MSSRIWERVLLIKMFQITDALAEIESKIQWLNQHSGKEKEQHLPIGFAEKTKDEQGGDSNSDEQVGKHTDIMVLIDHFRVFKEEVRRK